MQPLPTKRMKVRHIAKVLYEYLDLTKESEDLRKDYNNKTESLKPLVCWVQEANKSGS